MSKNTADIDTASVIETEALAWVAQLNGDDVSEKDLAAFREWAQRSPAHQKEIAELGQLWEDLNVLTCMDEAIRQADTASSELRSKRARRQWQKRILTSGAIACTLAMVWFTPALRSVFQQEQTPLTAAPPMLKSAIGQQQTHILKDGSVVTLNTDSMVEVDYSAKQRKVRLLKGEALFTVAEDKNRAFSVFANDGVISALGTEFSVRLQADKINVIVAEGTVELSTFALTSVTEPAVSGLIQPVPMESLAVLKAGQAAEIKDQKASIRLMRDEAIKAALSWKDGLLVFNGESLQQVINEVSRYTPLNIIIDDPQLQALRIGGVFNSGDTAMLFRTLETQFGLVNEPVSTNTVRISRRR